MKIRVPIPIESGRAVIVAAALSAVAMSISSCQETYYAGQNVTRESYPDFGAVVLLERRSHTFKVALELVRTYHYEITGRTEIEEFRRIKILTEEGLERYGDFVSSIYNKEYHQYSVEASVISPAGKRRTVGGDEIRRVSVGRSYFQYRIAIPGLEVGSVIEISEKVKSNVPILSGNWDFAEEVPTIESELVFKVPEDTKVMFSTIPKGEIGKVEPVKEGRYHVYRFRRENIPPYKKEKYMPPRHIGNPTLYYYVRRMSNETIAGVLDVEPRFIGGEPYVMTWRKVGEYYARYFNPETWQEDEKAEEYRSECEWLIEAFQGEQGGDTEETLEHLVRWFHDQFQSIDDEYLYASKNPEESYTLREGGPFELAYVLHSFLRKLGMRSYIVLLRDVTDGIVNRKTPTYNAFTHPIIVVGHGRDEFWIDPFNPYCRLNQLSWKCQGIESMWLLPSNDYVFKKIPYDRPELNSIENVEEITIDEEGNIAGVSRITMTGQYLLGLRRRALENGEAGSLEKELASFLERMFPEVFDEGSLEIVKEGNDSLEVTYRYEMPGFTEISGSYMNVDLSHWIASSLHDLFEGEKREHDIRFPYLKSEKSRVKVKLPVNVTIKEMPLGRNIEDDYIGYELDVLDEEGTVIISRDLIFRQSTVPAEKYTAVKEKAQRIYEIDRVTMVLERASL
ncbi:MAG: DUF3857 domain-containing protein [bacterium]|nr:MAG: DUF3857 domain-containing protein [bacterium]